MKKKSLNVSTMPIMLAEETPSTIVVGRYNFFIGGLINMFKKYLND